MDSTSFEKSWELHVQMAFTLSRQLPAHDRRWMHLCLIRINFCPMVDVSYYSSERSKWRYPGLGHQEVRVKFHGGREMKGTLEGYKHWDQCNNNFRFMYAL
ncbi:hypothetical protein PC128_g13372 [Phytophthora cactorum]|nr:hypothetical protein PC128_g13372 [Phytophthora cactorum]